MASSLFRVFFPRFSLWLWGWLILVCGAMTCCSTSPSTGVKWIKPPAETIPVGTEIALEWQVLGPSSANFNHTNVHACLSGKNDGCTCVPQGFRPSDCFHCCDGADRSQCNTSLCPRIDSQEQNGSPKNFTGTLKINQKGTWSFFVHARINNVDYSSDTVKVNVQ